VKTKTIKISVPAKYRWIATQPWGQQMLFTRKPKIDDDPCGPYWETQQVELEIPGPCEPCPKWRESVRRI
jgi:hypothetical protein